MVVLGRVAVSYERGTPVAPLAPHGEASPGHQQPDVNYPGSRKRRFPLNGDPRRVTVQGKSFKAETGKIVHFWLLVGGRRLKPDMAHELVNWMVSVD